MTSCENQQLLELLYRSFFYLLLIPVKKLLTNESFYMTPPPKTLTFFNSPIFSFFLLYSESTCSNSSNTFQSWAQCWPHAAELSPAFNESDEPVTNVRLTVHHQSCSQYILTSVLANDASTRATCASTLHDSWGEDKKKCKELNEYVNSTFQFSHSELCSYER